MRAMLIVIAAVLVAASMVASGSLWGLGVIAAALVVWRLAAHGFDPHHSARIMTTLGYVGVAAVMLALTTVRHPDDDWWRLCGVVFTGLLIVRSFAQEMFLRGKRHSRIQVGRSNFDESYYLGITSPPLFRWAHRIFALCWVWGFVSMATDMRPREEWDNAWAYVLPAFALLIFGPYAAVLELVLFPVTLLFLSTGVGAFWVLSDVGWFFYSALRRPTDRRTNIWRGQVAASRAWPWYYPT